MYQKRLGKLLQLIGLVSGLWLLLAGCGGSGGDGQQGSSAPGARSFMLHVMRSPETVGTARALRDAAAQVRQVQPGDPGFIERLESVSSSHRAATLCPRRCLR